MQLLSADDFAKLEAAREYLRSSKDISANPLAMMLESVVSRIEDLLEQAEKLTA
ncbi:MAG: hypothetical protein FJZ01_07245 [Candidatus Sericytochromatia bacterium]|nr:hypothetical protein [Candidatus Tanganyikabacteria bacterium]